MANSKDFTKVMSVFNRPNGNGRIYPPTSIEELSLKAKFNELITPAKEGNNKMTVQILRSNPVTGVETQFHDRLDTILALLGSRITPAAKYSFAHGSQVAVNPETIQQFNTLIAKTANCIVERKPFYFQVCIFHSDPAETLCYSVKNNYVRERRGHSPFGPYRLDIYRDVDDVRRELIGNVISIIQRNPFIEAYTKTDPHWMAVARVYIKAHLKLYSHDRRYYTDDIDFEVLDKMCARLAGKGRVLHITDRVEAGWSDPLSIIKLIHQNYGHLHFTKDRGFYFEQLKPAPLVDTMINGERV